MMIDVMKLLGLFFFLLMISVFMCKVGGRLFVDVM